MMGFVIETSVCATSVLVTHISIYVCVLHNAVIRFPSISRHAAIITFTA
jgi:hypothetical protein